MTRSLFAAFLISAALTAPASAQTPDAALDILKRSIAFQTFEGAGQVPAYAAYLKDLLVQSGYAPTDVVIEPLGETATLTATWPGSNPTLKPLVLLAHMDVVTADPSDWERDPFTPVVENGYVYGRGALDNKGDIAVLTATLIKLKQSGWTPRRTVILALSGDEETAMLTAQRLAEQLSGAEMVLNADGGGGLLADDGTPIVYDLQAAEKTYADYVLTFTDPGGHSSRPGPVNAIYRLGQALARIDNYDFPVSLNPVTRGYFEASVATTPGAAGQAIKRLLADTQDAQAIAVLTADPVYIGQIRTTCLATQIKGGHAPNALPQQATANINCRILPGVSMEEIEATLNTVVADPGVAIRYNDTGTIAAPASPLRPDVLAAVTKAVHARAPSLPIVPSMSAGATDSMHFRARGVPSYGVGSIFLKGSDDFAHGLNERVPLATLAPGIDHWDSILKSLAD